ncbi:MAG: S-adenosylmethionine:tRNA ribosyltransferase-isomerase [Fermentimonas sp.]|nr:S-adenosylmethionine:tRNA ribosyltransferase-isomerase [Fermentimonas sp.]MDD4008704.1 S-adenosylmethionine:tRNA ribosyltransferase-isomerase [Fermentimonas sp.]MDD4697619.1 S-adenosylmethionine:tRNA ribosyltransferase-isomerase [Fermentimonas sp.]
MKKGDIRNIKISDFTYTLPDEKIAKYPLPERDSSRLLIYKDSQIAGSEFSLLPEHLPENSLLIFNNTRVIHARLHFRKVSGAIIEIFCLSPYEPEDYVINFQQRGECSWTCMIGNARKWKDEVLSMEIDINGVGVTINAQKVPESDKSTKNNSDVTVKFTWDNESFTFSELLEVAGKLPIPPYLNRPAEEKDDETYQTLYSQVEGSVAAPTAGLHFTPEVMDRLASKGIQTAEVTLHVGAGTFKPVKSEVIAGHEMHTEFISVPKETIEKIINHTGDLIVVGTTSMRTVESLYYIGKKLRDNIDIESCNLSVNQWDPYEEEESVDPFIALRFILDYLEQTGQDQLISATSLMIVPGYIFHYPDAMITNFHQPQSTLLLLVSAFAGDDWQNIYEYALNNNFRFLSYGDSSLLWKNIK